MEPPYALLTDNNSDGGCLGDTERVHQFLQTHMALGMPYKGTRPDRCEVPARPVPEGQPEVPGTMSSMLHVHGAHVSSDYDISNSNYYQYPAFLEQGKGSQCREGNVPTGHVLGQ